MVKLDKKHYKPAYSVYLESKDFFPLIAAVLLDKQDGHIYADDSETPSQVYVEHAFGFAQIFGAPNTHFEHDLETYLLTDRRFHANKVRLYSLYTPNFLTVDNEKVSLSQRQRFILNTRDFTARSDRWPDEAGKAIELSEVNPSNIDVFDSRFEIVDRFWRSPDDFISNSNAIVVLYKGEPASICYSAATAENRAEIDVMTLPEYRKLNLAKHAVTGFIEKCARQSINPLWDCFSNNAPSMNLAKSVGFHPKSLPYRFYTINR